jgi:hypothetical protein
VPYSFFLFWSSSIILRKLVSRFSELNKNNDVVILGSSFVGALAYTFRIAFGIMPLKQKFMPWPPYLLPLFWLGLRWEQDMDKPRGNKWLLIISLVVGLSWGSLHGFINNSCNRFSFFSKIIK